jgi:hypothetical protein
MEAEEFFWWSTFPLETVKKPSYESVRNKITQTKGPKLN